MRTVRWSALKNERLKKVRGVSFEELFQGGRLIGIKRHNTRQNQRKALVEYRGYVWVVPFVRFGEEVFLKTIYPSRYWTKKYQRGEL